MSNLQIFFLGGGGGGGGGGHAPRPHIVMFFYTEPVQAKTVPADMYYMDNQRHRNSTVVNPG